MSYLDENIVNEWLNQFSENEKDARNYYYKMLLPQICEFFENEYSTKHACKTLVCLVGFNPESVILSTVALKPNKLIIITSENTKKQYDEAFLYLVTNKILNPSDIISQWIDETHPSEIYSVVEKYKSDDTVIDITGGKKVTSAAAAQAAWEFNLRIFYIDGEYNPDIRRPMCGTERLIFLEDPSAKKGRNARKRAVDSWKMRNFSLAKELLINSRDLNAVHNFEDVAIPLCNLYNALFNFDLGAVGKHVKEIKTLLDRSYLEQICSQTKIKDLISVFGCESTLEHPEEQISVFLILAEEYSKQQRFDFACLLSYRAMEAAIVQGLRKIAGDEKFKPANPKYDLLSDDLEDLKKKYIGFRKEISESDTVDNLPVRIGFMDGLIILLVSNPEIIINGFKKMKSPLVLARKCRGISEMRNRSILAHGDHSLDEDDFKKIYSLSIQLSMAICGRSIKEIMERIKPPKIENIRL